MKKGLATSLFKAAGGAAALTVPAATMAQAAPAAATLGPLAFAAPWALAGLAAVPVYWQMMRTIPPKPRDVDRPDLFLIRDLVDEKQKPISIPLWQRLLRTTALAAAIIGFAGPELNNDDHAAFAGDGPALLVINNSWESAEKWPDRVKSATAILEQADNAGRMVKILKTAEDPDKSAPEQLAQMSADDAKKVILTLQPQPWPSDYGKALETLSSTPVTAGAVFWLGAGVDAPGLLPFAQKLASIGKVQLFEDGALHAPRLLRLPQESSENLDVVVERSRSSKQSRTTLTAWDDKGKARGQVDVQIPAGESKATASFNLPQEIRNSISMITIDGDKSAGSVVLLDDRWRRQTVGIPDGGNSILDQGYYIRKALEDTNDVLDGSVDSIIEKQASVIILTDSARISDAERQKIDSWVAEGGTLLRFAGPNLAASNTEKDPLLPGPLYAGSRAPGASLAGQKKIGIAPFEESSPFASIKIPQDIFVERQVLARDTPDSQTQIWARLEDQTPLISAKDHGKGQIVLVHTTANLDWGNLVYSADLFKGILQTVVRQSKGRAATVQYAAALPPEKTLNAYGQMTSPPESARRLEITPGAAPIIGPANPPGFYGNSSLRHAHNLAAAVPEMKPLPPLPEGITVRPYSEEKEDWSLQGLILGLAVMALTLERLYTLKQHGAFARFRKPAFRP